MKADTVFSKVFAYRSTVCFFVMSAFFLSGILRVAVVATKGYSTVQANQESYRISLERQRGTIFDCNMIPLTNTEKYTVAAVSPTPSAAAGLKSLFPDGVPEGTAKELALGKPAVCRVPRTIDCEGISFAALYTHYGSDISAPHLIGYTDSTGHGAFGLEKAYDDILYGRSEPAAVFTVNGNGSALGGVSPSFENIEMPQSYGVVSTIDINIQNAVREAASGIEKGAVLVCEIKTGKIRAALSLPKFDPSNISSDLNNPNSPFLDRTVTAFSVGSVFKPCVAAAALDGGINNFAYNCTGSTYIIDRSFNCHKRDGHGEVDLQKALAFSCNTFFYNFSQTVGAERIIKKASILGFGNRLSIADNMFSDAGNLTSLNSLGNAAALANLSIGQGDLLLSPMSMLTLYCAIGGKGRYYVPSVVEGTVKNGKFIPYDNGSPTVAMSESTAETLLGCLSTVITEGTGKSAAPTLTSAAGKTATAQTGRYYDDGTEITNSWFCGVFPLEEPEYAVVIMSEGKQSVTDSQVFARTADGIMRLG